MARSARPSVPVPGQAGPGGWSRRRLLVRGAALLGAIGSTGLLAACGGAASATVGATTTTAPASTSAASSAASSAATSVATAAATTQSAVVTSTASAKASAPASAGLTLDFWNPADDPLGKEILGALVDKFNAQNSDFKVKDTLVVSDNNYEKYTAAMAGGAPPDAIMTYDYTPLPVWEQNDALLPLDSYAAEMKIDQNDYFPIVWPMINLKGHLWGFMQEFDSGILFWNRSLFSKNGMDPSKPPKTIAELDDMNTKFLQIDSSGAITQLGVIPGGPQGGSDTYWLAAFGGMYYDTLKAEFTINRPENVAALDWMAGWWKKVGGRKAINDFNTKYSGKDYKNIFTLERTGLDIDGEYRPLSYKKYFPNLDFANGFLPVQPNVTYGTGVAGGGNVFVLSKGIAHPKESVTFIRWMGGPDPVLEWNVKENNLPPIKSVALSDSFAQQTPLMKSWLDMLQLSATENHLVGPITHPAVADFNKLKGPILNDILDGKLNANNGLQQLDQQMQAVLPKYNK